MLTAGQISVLPHFTLPVDRVLDVGKGTAACKLLQSFSHSPAALRSGDLWSTVQQRNLNRDGKSPSG
jgi:hypothetical protein